MLNFSIKGTHTLGKQSLKSLKMHTLLKTHFCNVKGQVLLPNTGENTLVITEPGLGISHIGNPNPTSALSSCSVLKIKKVNKYRMLSGLFKYLHKT